MNNNYIYYISDLLWEKATTDNLYPNKNLSSTGDLLSLYVDNKIVTYNKGISAYSNSEIIFDIEKLNCHNFQSQIGIQANSGSTDSKVKFIVKADGIVIFESGIIPYMTSEFIDINISNTSKLTLITQSINSNNCDAIWADAKVSFDKLDPINSNYIFKIASSSTKEKSLTIINEKIYLQPYYNKLNQLFKLYYDELRCVFMIVDINNKENLLGINNDNLSFGNKNNLKNIYWQLINISDENYIIANFDKPDLVLEITSNNSDIHLNKMKNINDINISSQLFKIDFLNLFNLDTLDNFSILFNNTKLSNKKLYKFKNKNTNNLFAYNSNEQVFYMNTQEITPNTLFQLNYIPLQNAYKIKCLYASQENNDNNLVLDIRDNTLSKYITLSIDQNLYSQFWYVSEFDNNYFTISSKKYPQLTLTLSNNILVLSLLDYIDNTKYERLNDSQLFIIEEV